MSEDKNNKDDAMVTTARFTTELSDAKLFRTDHRSLQNLARIAATSTPAILVLHALTLDEQAAETFFELKLVLESLNERLSSATEVQRQPIHEMLSKLFAAVGALQKELE